MLAGVISCYMEAIVLYTGIAKCWLGWPGDGVPWFDPRVIDWDAGKHADASADRLRYSQLLHRRAHLVFWERYRSANLLRSS